MNTQNKNEFKKAFTLAEVLITLGIIGVVAALTIPALITTYQKQQTLERLKTVFSDLNQAMLAAIAENGPVTDWYTDDVKNIDGSGAKLFTDRYIVPYMKIINYCGNSTTGDCSQYNVYTLKKPNPDIVNWVWGSGGSKLFLPNGTLISFMYDNVAIRYTAYIDINGRANPNILGKDIFIYFYSSTSGKLLPMGYPSDRNTLTSSGFNWACNDQASTYAGWDCAALIMLDSWQMKSDYPW